MKHLFALLLITYSIGALSQKQGAYCIYAKQTFSAYGGCKSDPDFDKASLSLKEEGSRPKTSLEIRDLNTEHKLFSGSLEANTSKEFAGSINKLSVSVSAYATDIKNDKHIDYSVAGLDRGKWNIQSGSASDPCNNLISNKREGYTQTTTVTVDDPVYIDEIVNNGNNQSYRETEKIQLKLGDFYNNGNKPTLEVARHDGTGGWIRVASPKARISPGGTLSISYKDLMTGTELAPKYFEWLGKRLKFRVVKTLMNNQLTTGNETGKGQVIVYPEGFRFSISATRRTSCNPNTILTVAFDEKTQQRIENMDTASFYWSWYIGETTESTWLGDCTMEKTGDGKYTVIKKSGKTMDAFLNTMANDDIQIKLQFFCKENTDAFAYSETFTIPKQPDPITVTQKAAGLEIPEGSGTKYHIANANDPHAMLDITDPWEQDYLRRPYKVYIEGCGPNDTTYLSGLPKGYEEMSAEEKKALDEKFDQEWEEFLKRPNNSYKLFLKDKLDKWMKANPYGWEMDLGLGNSNITQFLFSNDGLFFLLNNEGNIYKTGINKDGTYSVEQKTNGNRCNSLVDISPNDSIVLINNNTVDSYTKLYKLDLSKSGISSPTEIDLRSQLDDTLDTPLRGSYFRRTRVFDSKNSFIYQIPGAKANRLFRTDLSTGRFTRLHHFRIYDVTFAPNDNRTVFLTTGIFPGTKLYKATISGNSLTNFTLLYSSEFGVYGFDVAHDGSFVVVPGTEGSHPLHKISLDGTDKVALPVAVFRNRFLTRDNQCIFFNRDAGTDTDYSERGLYKSPLDGTLGEKLIATPTSKISLSSFALSPNGRYFLYTKSDATSSPAKYTIYKRYMGLAEAMEDVYPNKGMAQSYYNEYYNTYKQKWLYAQLGTRIEKGVVANPASPQKLVLVDNDGCPYRADIKVTAPQYPNITVNVTKQPTGPKANDGEAEVTYNWGGMLPYTCGEGSLDRLGAKVTVKNLRYGPNEIKLYYGTGTDYISKSLTIADGTVVAPTPQYCGNSPDGTLSISYGQSIAGNKTYSIELQNGYGEAPYADSYATSSSSHTFTGLRAGKYQVRIASGATLLYETEKQVEVDTFYVAQISAPDITELGEKQTVSVAFAGQSGTVSWTDKDGGSPLFNNASSSSFSYSGAPAGTYQYTATHEGCNIDVGFGVTAPTFSGTIDIVQQDGQCGINIQDFGGNNLLGDFIIHLYDEENNRVGSSLKNNPNHTFTVPVGGRYTLQLEYGGGKTVYLYPYHKSDRNTFNTNLGEITAKAGLATESAYPGQTVTVEIGGVTGTLSNRPENIRYLLDPAIGYGASNTTTTTEPVLSYSVKDSLIEQVGTDNGCELAVTKTVIKAFSDTLPLADWVALDFSQVGSGDVTCHGLLDGTVSIPLAAVSNSVSGQYQYRLSATDPWGDLPVDRDDLPAGEYNISIRDKQNIQNERTFPPITIDQPGPLQLTDTVHQPTCEEDNGAIGVSVTGGNGAYSYYWQKDGADYHKQEADLDELSEEGISVYKDSIFAFGDTLPAGYYQLALKDYKGCQVTQNFSLHPYTNPAITKSTAFTDVACYEEHNGTITGAATKGYSQAFDSVGIHHYLLRAKYRNEAYQSQTGEFAALDTGFYQLYAIDDSLCMSNQPFPIAIGQPDTAVYMTIDHIYPVIGKGTASGKVSGTLYGGNPGLKNIRLLDALGNELQAEEQTSGFGFTFEQLPAGMYHIEATDSKGCQISSEALSVAEPESALTFTVTEKNDARCKAGTGDFTLQPHGGWGGYAFKRSTDNGFYESNTFSGLSAGSYIVTLKDKLGATYTETIVVHEPKDSLQAGLVNTVPPTCGGNGSITLEVKGGTAPYAVWADGSNDTATLGFPQPYTLSGKEVGNYLVHLTDSNGCKFELETNVSGENLLRITDIDPTYPTDGTTSNGQIRVTTAGGAAPIIFEWQQLFGAILPETGNTLSNVPSGNYLVTALGADNCSVEGRTYLPAITDRAFEVLEKQEETSYLAADGSIALFSTLNLANVVEVITPDNKKVEYRIEDVLDGFYYKERVVHLMNLGAGDYFVSAQNPQGEKAIAEFTIEPYGLFIFSQVTLAHAMRIDEASGAINVAVEGGAGDFLFDWNIGGQTIKGNDGETTSKLENIAAGQYQLTVTDKYGNTIDTAVQIKQPSEMLDIAISNSRNERCKTYEDAFVEAMATGGWGEYQFRIDSAEHFTNPSRWQNLEVRTFYFYVTDKMGVTDSVAITITEPGYLRGNVGLIDSVKCKDRSDGNVFFNIQGGTKPYYYTLKETPTANDWVKDTVARNFKEGTYTYYFTDSNSCAGQDTLTVYVPQPDSLLFKEINVTHTTCNTDNGIVSVQLQGGTQPYFYEWSDNHGNVFSSDSMITGLLQNGVYTLKAWDRNDCPQSHVQPINPSTVPKITDIDTTRVICHSESNGAATAVGVMPATPFAPYRITWENGDTGAYSSGYGAGVYHVSIEDTNGCGSASYFEVTEPDTLGVVLSRYKDALCHGYSDGYLKVSPLGGVGSYTYLWSNGDTTSLADSLVKGTYSVLLMDSNSCAYQKSYVIEEPPMLTVDLGKDLKICPGNIIDLDPGEYTTYKWSTASGVFSENRIVTLDEAGTYHLEVTDDSTCLAWDEIGISIGNDALEADFIMPSHASLGDTLEIFEVSNMDLDSLVWEYDTVPFSDVTTDDMPSYVLDLENSQEGIYNVALYAYSGGCISKAIKQVEILYADTVSKEIDVFGYKGPLIKSIKVMPNPTDGIFLLKVELREVADIQVAIYNINYGKTMDMRQASGLDMYDIDYQLYGLVPGAYVIMVQAAQERKQLKIIVE